MIFFLYGEDNYSSNEKLKQIKEKFVRDVDVSGYNIVVLDEKINLEKLSKELSQSGFLVSKKLVVVKNILGSNISKDLGEYILDYLEKSEKNKDEENIIVFYENNISSNNKNPFTGEKLRVFKKLESLKYAQEFKIMTADKIVAWIVKKFDDNSKIISRKLAQQLFARVGNDFHVLENDINKISNYNKEKEIKEDSVESLCSSFVNDDIFLFCERLGEKKTKEAIDLLNHQFRSGANEIYIFSMIIRQFRILLQIRSAIDEGISPNNIASYVSLHPFVVKKSIPIAKIYTIEELKKIYKKLLDLDIRLKSSKLDKKTLLEIFVLSI